MLKNLILQNKYEIVQAIEQVNMSENTKSNNRNQKSETKTLENNNNSSFERNRFHKGFAVHGQKEMLVNIVRIKITYTIHLFELYC